MLDDFLPVDDGDFADQPAFVAVRRGRDFLERRRAARRRVIRGPAVRVTVADVHGMSGFGRRRGFIEHLRGLLGGEFPVPCIQLLPDIAAGQITGDTAERGARQCRCRAVAEDIAQRAAEERAGAGSELFVVPFGLVQPATAIANPAKTKAALMSPVLVILVCGAVCNHPVGRRPIVA